MAGDDGQHPAPQRRDGCDRCSRDPAPTWDWVLNAAQLVVGLAGSGHDDATVAAVASLLVLRLMIELDRQRHR